MDAAISKVLTIPKIFLKDFLKTFLRPCGSKGYG